MHKVLAAELPQSFIYDAAASHGPAEEGDSVLLAEAFAAQRNAYVPYSHFRVGAAVLADDGQIYSGCNIENASFGATNCAERTAVFKAISAGCRSLRRLALITDAEDYGSPCGICRQVMAEFAPADFHLLAARPDGHYIVQTMEDLLPGAFTLLPGQR